MTTILDKFNLTGKVAVGTGGVELLGTEFCRTLTEAGAGLTGRNDVLFARPKQQNVKRNQHGQHSR